jgi:hypothetical protein
MKHVHEEMWPSEVCVETQVLVWKCSVLSLNTMLCNVIAPTTMSSDSNPTLMSLY